MRPALKYILFNEAALRMAVLTHSILIGVYEGQEINVRSLIQFQEASSTQFAFSRLMDLVPILICDDNLDESVEALREVNGIKKGVSKAAMKKILKRLQEDLYFLKGTKISD